MVRDTIPAITFSTDLNRKNVNQNESEKQDNTQHDTTNKDININ
jgi:hypothetical protein